MYVRQIRIVVDGESVLAKTDGTECWFVRGGRTVRVPYQESRTYRTRGRARCRPEPEFVWAPEDERDEFEVMEEKLARVREAAARRPAPKSARESYLHARYRQQIRETGKREFEAGIAEGKARLMKAPLADRVTEADKHEMVEMVMRMVLANPGLREQWKLIVDMYEDLDEPAGV